MFLFNIQSLTFLVLNISSFNSLLFTLYIFFLLFYNFYDVYEFTSFCHRIPYTESVGICSTFAPIRSLNLCKTDNKFLPLTHLSRSPQLNHSFLHNIFVLDIIIYSHVENNFTFFNYYICF